MRAIVVGSDEARRVLREVVKPAADVLAVGCNAHGRRYSEIDVLCRIRDGAPKRWLANIADVDAAIRTWA